MSAPAVHPGRHPVLYVHDLGGSPAVRTQLLADARAVDAWSVELRGHGDADWVRGRYYDLAAFAADLAWVLRERLGRPAALVASGAGGLVAAAVAAALPDFVTELRLAPADPHGWSEHQLVSDAAPDDLLDPNPNWLTRAASLPQPAPGRTPGADDPVLALGPPVPVRRTELRARLAGLRCGCSGDPTWVNALFP